MCIYTHYILCIFRLFIQGGIRMARPQKQGLDYFPLDVDMDQDDKIQLIEAEHGLVGFAIVIKLLMKIYKEGYFYHWTEKEQLIFSKRVNADINQVNAVINSCIKWGLFDKNLFEKHNILTSKGIQRRYLEAISRRKKVTIIKEFYLLQNEYSNVVFVDINGVNVDKNYNPDDINDSKNPQSKVKKSKVKYHHNNTDDDLQVDDDIVKAVECYEDYGYGTINKAVSDFLIDMVNEYGIEWVKEALYEGAIQNKRTLKYVAAILQRWKANGGISHDFKKEKEQQPQQIKTLTEQLKEKYGDLLAGGSA